MGLGGIAVAPLPSWPLKPALQRVASDLGWTPATIVPLDLWCKTPRRCASWDGARASSRGEVGRGPARQGACHRARGCFVWNFARLASHQTHAPEGRVRPRDDASNDCYPQFMVQIHPTPCVSRRCTGVLPKGKFDAARRAKARGSGQEEQLSELSSGRFRS